MKTISAITFVLFWSLTSLQAQSTNTTNTNIPLINPPLPNGAAKLDKMTYEKTHADNNGDVTIYTPTPPLPIGKTKVSTIQIEQTTTTNTPTDIPVMPDLPIDQQSTVTGEANVLGNHGDNQDLPGGIPVMPDLPISQQVEETIMSDNSLLGDNESNTIPVMPNLPIDQQLQDNTTQDIQQQDDNNALINSNPMLETSAVELNVFPNPTTDVLYINTTISDDYVVDIHNLAGQKVYSQQVYTNNTTIESGNWTSGLYILTITNNNGELIKQAKIVKK